MNISSGQERFLATAFGANMTVLHTRYQFNFINYELHRISRIEQSLSLKKITEKVS